MNHFSGVLPGIARIPADWTDSLRVGLVAHPASRLPDGRHSAEFLRDSGLRLAALFGPEHGFFGRGGAGEPVSDALHPSWNVPIFSLYGETRSPSPEMLDLVDVVVFDVQTIACRAYTYGSTLRLLMEACAKSRKRLVVADRPDPLMFAAPDGPFLEPDCESFVGMLPAPFCHGMTAGEIALFLRDALRLECLDLRVAPCSNLSRSMPIRSVFPSWTPPSPAILSTENALCFPITVFLEALPMVDHARGTPLAFQCIGSSLADLANLDLPPLPGLRSFPFDYPDKHGNLLRGLRFEVLDPAAYRPAAAAWNLVSALEERLGPSLWDFPGTRPDFYAKLWGSRSPSPPWRPFARRPSLYP